MTVGTEEDTLFHLGGDLRPRRRISDVLTDREAFLSRVNVVELKRPMALVVTTDLTARTHPLDTFQFSVSPPLADGTGLT